MGALSVSWDRHFSTGKGSGEVGPRAGLRAAGQRSKLKRDRSHADDHDNQLPPPGSGAPRHPRRSPSSGSHTCGGLPAAPAGMQMDTFWPGSHTSLGLGSVVWIPGLARPAYVSRRASAGTLRCHAGPDDHRVVYPPCGHLRPGLLLRIGRNHDGAAHTGPMGVLSFLVDGSVLFHPRFGCERCSVPGVVRTGAATAGVGGQNDADPEHLCRSRRHIRLDLQDKLHVPAGQA